MTFDPDQITPSGKPFAQMDAEEGLYVASANESLESLGAFGCRWWDYSVSHRTFVLVVGDPLARGGNLVINLAACDFIGGPVSWEKQQLRVLLDNNRQREKAWLFTLTDETVKFRVTAGHFGWRRDFDLLKHKGLLFLR